MQCSLIRPVNNIIVLQLELGFLKWFRFIHIYIYHSLFRFVPGISHGPALF